MTSAHIMGDCPALMWARAYTTGDHFWSPPHHPIVRATDKVDALEIQIHQRDPGAAGNPIFNSVLSSVVVLNFTLITEVAC